MASKILFVSVEPLWPATHGGRLRSAKIAEALAESENVLVTAPVRRDQEATSPARGIHWQPLEWEPPQTSWGRFHWLPWLGLYAIQKGNTLQAVVDNFKPDYIYWSHSYMAAVGMRRINTTAKNVVEFANIERDRYRSLARYGRFRNRVSALAEWLKAGLWERSISKSADLCVAIHRADHELLLERGANAILVENAMPFHPVGQSPSSPTVLSVGNWDYAPNRDGIVDFLERHWGHVIEAIPQAKLVLAGKGSVAISEKVGGSRNVQGLGFVEDLTEEYRNAALFLAPAKTGAGSQLKIAEALGHARCVVGPKFLNREIRPGLPEGALTGTDTLAGTIIDALLNPVPRWGVEKAISEYVKVHTWPTETQQLRDWMRNPRQ